MSEAIMINLNVLPPAAKKRIRREILLRVFATSMFFLASWTFLFFLLAAQALLVLGIQNDALKGRLEVEERTDTAQKTLAFEQTLKQVNASLSYASSIRKEPYDDASSHLALIAQLVPEGITLRSFELGTTVGKLTIGGRARTREGLLLLEKRLKEQSVFSGVESPVSNLLQPQDIDFSFSLTLTRQAQ